MVFCDQIEKRLLALAGGSPGAECLKGTAINVGQSGGSNNADRSCLHPLPMRFEVQLLVASWADSKDLLCNLSGGGLPVRTQ